MRYPCQISACAPDKVGEGLVMSLNTFTWIPTQHSETGNYHIILQLTAHCIQS